MPAARSFTDLLFWQRARQWSKDIFRGGVRTLGKTVSWSSRTWEIYERITGQPRPSQFDEPEPDFPVQPRDDAPPV
jgi:hypothetical protein